MNALDAIRTRLEAGEEPTEEEVIALVRDPVVRWLARNLATAIEADLREAARQRQREMLPPLVSAA